MAGRVVRNGKWLPTLVLGFLLLALVGLFIPKGGDPTPSNISDLSWVEDVTLANGEVIKFTRRMRIEQNSSWGAGGSLGPKIVQIATLDLATPDGSFVPWSAPLIPFYLDKDSENGEWVVIGASDDYQFIWANGEPCPPQYAFRLRKGVWYLQPVPKHFLGKLPNLMADLRIMDDAMYSAAQWPAIVSERKISQIPERGLRLTPTARSVGELSNDPQCKDKEPQFTGDFRPDNAISSASLRNFPHLQ